MRSVQFSDTWLVGRRAWAREGVMGSKAGMASFAMCSLAWSLCGGLSSTASGLTTGRVYEMVSPPYKGGYAAGSLIAIAPDGDRVVFTSLGAFAGVLSPAGTGVSYLARRGSAGWSTESLQTPPGGDSKDFSSDLEYVLGLAPNAAGGEDILLQRTDAPVTAGGWELLSAVQALDGGEGEIGESSGDAGLCHLVLADAGGALLPEATNTEGQLYDFARGCSHEERSLRLIAVRNRNGANGEPGVINGSCRVVLGDSSGESGESEGKQKAAWNDLAAGGAEIFFTANVGASCAETGRQVFVRLGGRHTVEVSRPASLSSCNEVPCKGASERANSYFKGASQDGSRVFFTTTASLVNGDEDTGNDLYMARIECPEGEPECEVARRQRTALVQVSHDPVAGQPADVQGVLRIARDGSRVYFVAHGVLSESANGQGEMALDGADNLYVYDSNTENVAFIAALCSGPARSGSVEDGHCPSNLSGGRNDGPLWTAASGGEAQSTPDGGVFVFSSYARLTADDADPARDVYRYDAATGTLERISIGEAGYHANGNDGAYDATLQGSGLDPDGSTPAGSKVYQQYEMNTRAVSDDGSRVVFETAEPLSPAAVNGLNNVYEWHEGEVSLISSGDSPLSDTGAVITPSGSDIFFETAARLAPVDVDEFVDVYDARMGGGFPAVPGPRGQCSADACQGPLTIPAPLLIPGSVSQAPGGNFVHRQKTKKATKRKHGKKHGKQKRTRRAARDSRSASRVGGGKR
jgi:hypothetical protein